ncbi:hypothetical protein [Nocardiopsis aegyptia]|uniref:Uncharacterized protein n=1 Tax=Nocardiopsis aegyptia TaxID=220378 RepID=A0A7Z0EMU8_9ACTN|nr:hypothetical protein [Nocardiopsis aegyptia]NYJ35047.1 hypothetical protein [Nocardiopsis aegyptia]
MSTSTGKNPRTTTEPVRRALRRWPAWAGYAAAVWSFVYGALGLLWALGLPGFPFGVGDLPDARKESVLGFATATGVGAWIAVLGLVGAAVALLLARSHAHGVGRVALLGYGWAAALALIVVIPDQRVLTTLAYTPIALVGIPFGWPPLSYGEFVGLAYPWTTTNLMLCAAGGVLWAAATLAFQFRTNNACERCGRTDRTSRWAAPAAAARWGRWAAYTAALIPFAYAATRWAWVFGFPLTISQDFLDELHANEMVWAGAYLATFGALGGVLTLGLVQRWGVIWPRWVLGLAGKRVPPIFPISFASVVAVSLASAGFVMARLIDWGDIDSVVGNPGALWPLWAAALGAATLAYHLRTRGACGECGRDDR